MANALTMKLWCLFPIRGDRSDNWKRSSYKGDMGAVVVRAATAFDARGLAAMEFEQPAPSKDTLFSPWMTDDDTEVAECEDARYTVIGEPQVLHPTRASVTA